MFIIKHTNRSVSNELNIKKMKKIIYLTSLIALIYGCNNNETQVISQNEQRIPVNVIKVTIGKTNSGLSYSGTIEPFQSVPLTFQSNGTVEKVLADAGDAVKKGQLLATLDNTDIQNIYNISLAKYQQAKDAYDRLKSVHEQGSLPDIKWIEMETNLSQAKSSLDISRNNLNKCNLYAPQKGIIGKRNIEPGMSALTVTSAPFELVNIESVYVKISVPENEIGKIKKGMKALFRVSALGNHEFEGYITKISPIADAISRTYEAKILVNNKDEAIKPGMVCDVTVNQQIEKEVLLIPFQCVSKDAQGKPFVFTVDTINKKAKKQTIEKGNYYGNSLEVLSGLVQGQIIVSEGKEKLADNSLISL